MARHGISAGHAKRIIEPARGLADDFQVAADCVMDHRNARPRRLDTSGVIENRSQHSRMWIKYRRGSLAGMVSESNRFGEDPVADVGVNRAAFEHVDLCP